VVVEEGVIVIVAEAMAVPPDAARPFVPWITLVFDVCRPEKDDLR